jgi:hypothetical protein
MKKPYAKVYISIEDENGHLVIDGPLELLRQFLEVFQQVENEHLRGENELLRSQLDYWKEREAADPLPFAEEESDE